MDVGGEFEFDAPQTVVWEVMQDPRALAFIIPSTMDMKRITDTHYTGALFFKVGSMAGMFRGDIELFNLVAPDSYDIKVNGSSAVGAVSIVGTMRLQPHDTQTTMTYDGKVDFVGRIVSVGSRVLESSVRMIMQQSFSSLNHYLAEKHQTKAR